mgnify:CR=1 FL=1
MARKSSFLQGFEVGQDLYSRGVAQAQSTAQMQIQKDTQAQRGRLLDMQLKESAARLAEQNRVRTKQAENRKTSGAALLEFKEVIQVGKTVEQRTQKWFEHRSKYEPLIALHAETNNGYGIWKQAEILDTQTYKTIQAEKEDKRLESIAKLTWGQKQRLTNFETRAKAKSITGKDYTEDADGAGIAQSDIYAAQSRGFYITGGEKVPENLDRDGDGLISAAERDYAQGDVTRLGRVREAKLVDEEREFKRQMTQLGFEGRGKLADQSSKLKRLESLNEQATLFGESGYEVAKINAALDGETSLTELGKINKGLAARAGILRGKLKMIAQNPDTPGVDAIRVSSVFTNDLGTSEKAQLNKALSVKGQIERLGSGGYIEAVNTGRYQNKVAEVKAWFNTKGSRDLAVLEGLLNAVIPNLARGVYGEIGVLTDKDVDLYKGTFISPKNDEEVNRALFGLTEKLVHGAIKRQLKTAANGRVNVSGYRDVWEELTGEQVSPHIREMISPGGASGAPGGRPGAGRPSQQRLQQMVSIEPGQKFETEEQWRDALEIGAAAYPVGTKFPGLMVGDANAKAIAPDPAKVKEWNQQFVGRPGHDGRPAVHPSWVALWEKEGAEKTDKPTPEVTAQEVTTPEAPTPEVTTPEVTTPEAPAKPEAPEAEPVETTEEANIVLNNIGISDDGKTAGVLRKHFRFRQIKELEKLGTDKEKSEWVEAFIKSLKGGPKAKFMADFNELKKSRGKR